MKANKVPEKLYCCDKGNGNLFVDYRPFPNDESIEYIRTNAFIEKAANWLINNTDITPTGIKNFRKAMKGE